jgi:hypothetical protein
MACRARAPRRKPGADVKGCAQVLHHGMTALKLTFVQCIGLEPAVQRARGVLHQFQGHFVRHAHDSGAAFLVLGRQH